MRNISSLEEKKLYLEFADISYLENIINFNIHSIKSDIDEYWHGTANISGNRGIV